MNAQQQTNRKKKNTNMSNIENNIFALILEEARGARPLLSYSYIDPVTTVDGSTAERHDCERVRTNSAYRYSSWATWDYYTTDQFEAALNIGSICHIPTRDEYYIAAECVFCEDDEWCLADDAVYVEGSGWYHHESDDIRMDGRGTVFLEGDSDYVYCHDGEYWPESECHYCEANGEDIHCEEDECPHCNADEDEDEDDADSEPNRSVICNYHSSPEELKYRGGSPFLIGFEVEKTNIFGLRQERQVIGERDLFAGWERDASCGVEGVTHCYDLLDSSIMEKFERHVAEANDVLAEPCDSSCGGHINISWMNVAPRDTLAAFKVYAPLWYALFRKRLNNTYCREDKKIEDRGIKYSPVRCKSFGIELRLPSRVLNAKHLLRRARLITITCRAMEENWSFNRFVRESRSILLKEAYNGDRKRYAKALRLARHFRIWMLDGIVHPDISEYTQ